MYFYFWFVVAIIVFGWVFQIHNSYKVNDPVQRLSLRLGSILGACIFIPFFYLIYPALQYV